MAPLQKNTELIGWFIRIGGFVMSIAVAVSSWFLKDLWTKYENIDNAVRRLEIQSATTSGNRFTSNDWMAAKGIIDTERTALDRRIVRLEESLPTIERALLKIEGTIDKLHNDNMK